MTARPEAPAAPAGPPGAAGTGGPGVAERQAGARAAASNVAFGPGPNCRPDGRQIGISLYMPPCADWQGTDNGGATADGVTGNQVKVIRWLGQLDDATKAILQANKLGDDDATVARAYHALFSYSNHHYETYGREVVFEDYQASALSTNQEAMIADAAQIADKHPFAVIEGNPGGRDADGARPRAERARRAVPVHDVAVDARSTRRTRWSCRPACRAARTTATSRRSTSASGSPGRTRSTRATSSTRCKGFKNKPRVFGLMYLNGALGQVDPEGERLRATCEKAFAQYGVSFAVQLGYIYDPGRNQNDVSNMIAQLKAAGVTTIVPLVDPLSPILITPEATRQNYFPEWFVTGTGLSDTTTAGRLYDQNQWRHVRHDAAVGHVDQPRARTRVPGVPRRPPRRR